MNDAPVKIQIRHQGVRWTLKQAAAERRTSLRELATSILSAWLEQHGYEVPKTDPSEPTAT